MTCFRKYADFSGRASQAEFWWFYGFSFLVQLIVGLPLMFLLVAAAGWILAAAEAGIDPFYGRFPFEELLGTLAIFGGVSLVVWAALLPPYLAVQSRRLHDMNQTGWWVALNAIGLGSIPTVMALMPSHPEANEWGEVP